MEGKETGKRIPRISDQHEKTQIESLSEGEKK